MTSGYIFRDRLLISLICLYLLSSCGLQGSVFYRPPAEEPPVEEYPALAHINKIYIDNLGNGEKAEMVREKIRLRLMKSKRFSVVEVSEKSDSILKGVAGVNTSYYSRGIVYEGSGGSSMNMDYTGFAVLHLVDAHTSELIWSFEYENGCSESSESDCVADATVEKLIQDAARAGTSPRR